MVSRDAFVEEGRPRWTELEALLATAAGKRRPGADIGRTAVLYRAACADLMRARSVSLGSDVTGYLDALVSRGHSALYGPKPYSLKHAAALLFTAFPRTLRAHAAHFWVSSALFYVPLALGCYLALTSDSFALSVLPREALEQAEESYSQALDGRPIDANTAMAGFYVWNNVGIAFRCFATGVLFGVGSVFFLFYNGLAIGTTVGYVVKSGGGPNILTFMCGHGPFELTAIAIAGAAGLRLGQALVAPRGLTRWAALRNASRPVGDLILGAAVFLLIAAAIEGFWSPSALPAQVKWGFSAAGAVTITVFLLAAGRVRKA